jgi:hypothetical protein
MSKGRIRRMFPGGNTSQGFFSYYDNILSQEDAKKIIILKGGPGVGKSTFMKLIGMEMVEKGFDVEFMQCSSDNKSLDGIVIPLIKVAIIDGTAPHMVDPKNPGAVDEIINLGDFWDGEGISENKEAILKLNREINELFIRAYRYLKASAIFHEDTKIINRQAIDKAKVNLVAEEIIKENFSDTGVSTKMGKNRHLFASAITPDGLKNYLETVLITKKVYFIKGQQGTGTETLLEKVRQAAVERGFDAESYYCALHPGKLEHLLIPQKDISFTTENDYHKVNTGRYREYDLNEFLDKDVVKENIKILQYNKSMFEQILAKAVETIKMAKYTHDEIENYYIPNMDFAAQIRLKEAILAGLIDYAESISKL